MPECEEAYTNREEKEETEMKVLKKITWLHYLHRQL